MRLKGSFFATLVNMLLGVAWALTLIGAFYLFSTFFIGGLLGGLIMAFWGALPGLFLVVMLEYILIGIERLDELRLFLVVMLEYILIGIERLDELKKQTLLLEHIVSKNSVATHEDEIVQKIVP